MKKIALLLSVLSIFAATVKAQNYFDDKWFDQPVKYRITYTNERYRINKIIRNSYWTVFEIMYDDPYCFENGWMCMEHTVSMQDQDTKKTYWLTSSTGIPKEPDRYVFKESGAVKKLITLFFPPLPESVRTVALRGGEMSFYDVAIGNIKPQLDKDVRIQDAPQHVSKDKALKLDRITHDSKNTVLYFTYTAPNPTSVSISTGTKLTDSATGQTFNMINTGGIPRDSKKLYMAEGSSLSFFLVFPTVPSTVKKINMTNTAAGEWDISGIVLE